MLMVRVRRAERLPNNGALFHLDAGFLNGTGWAYLPDGAPTSATDEICFTVGSARMPATM